MLRKQCNFSQSYDDGEQSDTCFAMEMSYVSPEHQRLRRNTFIWNSKFFHIIPTIHIVKSYNSTRVYAAKVATCIDLVAIWHRSSQPAFCSIQRIATQRVLPSSGTRRVQQVNEQTCSALVVNVKSVLLYISNYTCLYVYIHVCIHLHVGLEKS